MNIYESILRKFPRKIVYSFAYGSAVKPQLGYNGPAKMIDLIFCVDKSLEWHGNNLLMHRDHYSSFKYLGHKFISSYQEKTGANIYYNTLIELSDLNVKIKYGVISVENMINDLKNWNYLYIAGRLQKPVNVLIKPENCSISEALAMNLISAVRTALLLLPEKFTDYHLFLTISNLSYGGDFRMIFGESKNKVQNIVKPQLNEFYELYLPAMKDLSQYMRRLSNNADSDKIFQQDKSQKSTIDHLKNLPINLQTILLAKSNMKGTQEEVFRQLCTNGSCAKILANSINDIVWKSSIYQSLKNIPTAGIVKSIKYSWSKAIKTFY